MNAPISSEAAETAAAWFARRDTGDWTPDDQIGLEAWLAADPGHAQAWARLEDMWASLKHAPADIADAARAEVKQRRRKRAAAMGAAGAALCVALAAVFAFDLPMRLSADIVTVQGERRDVVLDDGSRVTLDTDSAISVEYSANERRIALLRGRAAFDVEADRSRRFVVDADGVTTTARGTVFVVQREQDTVGVVVTEHSVEMADDGAQALVVHEGEGARWSHGVGALEPVDVYAATAWRRGLLMVEDRPLREVAAEIDRYFPGIIMVTGAARDIRVSGVFEVDDPNVALDLLQRTFDLEIERAGDTAIVISN